jgi:pentatricopeptide repeat protein
MDGHDVRLYVPAELLGEIDVDKQEATITFLRDDLQRLAQNIEREYIHLVQLEMAEDDDPDYRRATVLSGRPSPNPDQLGIWKNGHVRVFISHRNQHRAAAHHLCRALEDFGFTCFVAHDTIPANEEWRRTIVNGLETMEVLLAFITDDFEYSTWRMQEVGYALGKGIPVVSLKLESKDPPGFISERQALRGSLDRPAASAGELFILLADAIGRRDRIQAALVKAFVESGNFDEARDRFDTMKRFVEKLTDAELSIIIDGYYRNDQLYRSIYLDNQYDRLVKFLNDTTGRQFTISQRTKAKFSSRRSRQPLTRTWHQAGLIRCNSWPKQNFFNRYP